MKPFSNLTFIKSALRLLQYFAQQGKNESLKNLVLDENDLSLDDAAGLVWGVSFVQKRNPNMNTDNPAKIHLLFYKIK